jgi:Holliday junction resolvase RusA-like endonuclease
VKPRLCFTIPGEAVPCARPRAMSFMKEGKAKARVYMPDETSAFENFVALNARMALTQNMAWAELALSEARFVAILDFFVLQPERADGDNMEKSTYDGLQRASTFRIVPPHTPSGKCKKVFESGVFRNDRLIRAGLWCVHQAEPGKSRIEVVIRTIPTVVDKPIYMMLALEDGWLPPRAAERTA